MKYAMKEKSVRVLFKFSGSAFRNFAKLSSTNREILVPTFFEFIIFILIAGRNLNRKRVKNSEFLDVLVEMVSAMPRQ